MLLDLSGDLLLRQEPVQAPSETPAFTGRKKWWTLVRTCYFAISISVCIIKWTFARIKLLILLHNKHNLRLERCRS